MSLGNCGDTMIQKNKRKAIYTKYLTRLYAKKYLTDARKGLLSESGSKHYNRTLRENGFVVFRIGKANKKFAEFSNNGKKFLQEYGVLNDKFEIRGIL